MIKSIITTLITVLLISLKRPKFAEEIYEINDIESLMESIKVDGIITPPIIDEDFNILSGSRVIAACLGLG